MEIRSNFNAYAPKNPVSFGVQYPYEDIMSIMSGSYLTGRQGSVEKTVAEILHKEVATDPIKRYLDNIDVRRMLLEQHPELIPFSNSFRKALDNICINHFRITVEDVQFIIERESNKYGKKFIDIA